MQWITPSEKDNATNTLEKRLWEAADQLRANSGLTAAQYSSPVLGLIFLRFAEARFAKRRDELEKAGSTGRRGSSRIDEPGADHAESFVYLTPNARYDHLLNLPEGANVGKEINDAITNIEKHNRHLAGCCHALIRFLTARCSSNCSRKFPRFPRISNTTPLAGSMNTSSASSHSLQSAKFHRLSSGGAAHAIWYRVRQLSGGLGSCGGV